MTCLECGHWAPPCPETGYDADRYCSAACEQAEWERDLDEFLRDRKTIGGSMPETTRQRRTAGLILELIEMRLAEAEVEAVRAESDLNAKRERVITIRAILADAKKNGAAE